MSLLHPSSHFHLLKKSLKSYFKPRKKKKPIKLPRKSCPRKRRNKLKKSQNSGLNMNKVNLSGKSLGNPDK
jgi:hypothetical protein